MRLKGSAVLLTGASSGIGAEAALKFARKRARLALCARRLDNLEAVAERCRRAGSPAVLVRQVDVRRRDELGVFVQDALAEFGHIDVLVNNAGYGWRGKLEDMPEPEVRSLMETNFMAAVWTTQAVLPSMLARRRGVIVNISSIVGFRPGPYSTLYSASKYALTGFSHALRGELSGTGVKVSVVYPGWTRTEFFARTETAEGPQYPVRWVAASVVRAARFPRRDVVMLPFRIAMWAEPFIGGFLDHLLGELRRANSPHLRRTAAEGTAESRAAGEGGKRRRSTRARL